MKICPHCKEEFLDHIELCTGCNEKLLHEFDLQGPSDSNTLFTKEQFFKDETTPLIEGGLAQCREIEKLLLKSKINCAVYPVSLQCDSNSTTIGTCSDMKYMVLVRSNDIDEAKKALQGRFIDQIAKEGKGKYIHDAINLDEETITCPACGESNPLKDGECPVCGLCLGIIETK